MKRLVSPSTVLTLSNHSKTGRGSHIPAWANSRYSLHVDGEICGSGGVILFFLVTLKDDLTWFYPCEPVRTADEVTAIFNQQFTYAPYPNFNYGAGIFFNAVLRQMVTDKISNADWPAWVAAH